MMVTHDPKAVSFLDRVVFVQDGQIVDHVALGGPDDVERILVKMGELE
jgi:ABC-type lipoprotein export system ATPase subunit